MTQAIHKDAQLSTKEHPILFSAPMVQALLANRKHVTRRLSKQWLKVKAGDRLWVRETFADPHYISDYPDSEVPVYRADNDVRVGPSVKWRPSIHMPRWASRILLECGEDARLEPLHAITEEESIDEGMTPCDFWAAHDCCPAKCGAATNDFRNLWDTLHTKPGERWLDNPEVVRVGRFWRVA